jgi:uncharacterized protein (TIGR03067 family)
MKKLFAGVVVFSLSALLAVAQGEKKAAPKIEGTWTQTGGILEGKKLPGEIFDELKTVLTFKDGKYSQVDNGNPSEAGTYKVDATKTPATIDFVVEEGREKGKLQLAIFKIEGETITLALAQHGSNDRPKNFDGENTEGVMVLKRNK